MIGAETVPFAVPVNERGHMAEANERASYCGQI